ncbi:MAG: zinc ribbon domain-containing protein, partial [Chloroflexi bacterium]|nr:zinc ribbon domain-containing protein [Chloroflexota bacterium]
LRGVGLVLLAAVILPASVSAGDNANSTVNSPGALIGGNVVAITAAYDSTFALTSSGEVWAWGSTHLLIEGTYGLDSTTPILVEGLSDVQAISAASDGQHVCVLTRAGDVKCWGYGGDGQLGNGSTESAYAPADVAGLTGNVIAIGAGLKHTCAVLENGTIKCWGGNEYGQLGDGTTETRLTSVSVYGISDAVAVAAGQMYTCALTNSGGVKCWGEGVHLGSGSYENSLVPVDVLGLGSGVQFISAGVGHTCAVTTSGGLKCWGNWFSGGLGTSEDYVSGYTPVDVVGLTSGVETVSAGGRHTCAILTGGRIQCWGENETYGNLGIDTDETHLLPVDVPGITGATALATGEAHTCAVISGEVWCWGANTSGQLGDGTQTNRWSPVRVGGGGGFRSPGPLVPEITTYIPTPLDLSPEPAVIGTNLLLAALMMLPFAVAAEFFTRTMAENEETLKRRFRPITWVVRLQERMARFFGQRLGKTRLGDILKVAGVMLFYGLVFSLLDKTWNPFSLKGLVLFGSMTIAYGLVGVADDILQWRRIRRWGLPAELKVRPTNILLAALSMTATRILSLVPGLMFGTPEALETDENQFDEPKRDTLLRISGLTFIIIGLVVWLPTVATSLLLKLGLPEMLTSLLGGLEAILLVIFAVALENLFIQMLGFPGSFGHSLKRKSRWLWIGLLVLVTFVFYHTLINPRGELAAALEEGNVILFLSVAAAFVLFTFGMRLFFRIRNRRAAAITTTPLPATPQPAAPSQTVPPQTPVAAPPGVIPAAAKPPATPAPSPAAPPKTVATMPVTEAEKAPVTVSISEERQCPICGNTIKAGAKLCRFCRATFTVIVRGYCLTDHEIVEVNDDGKCKRCGGEPADLHVESRLLQAPAVRPIKPTSEKAAAQVIAPEVQIASGTKQCPSCGQTIKAEAKICRFCRTNLDAYAPAPIAAQVKAPQAESAADTKQCPSCGQTIKAEAKICRFCKTILTSGPAPAIAAQPLPVRPSQSNDALKLVAEALEIIENKVIQYKPGMGYVKVGGTDSQSMVAAEKLGEAYKLQPNDLFLQYAYASALHLAMQYKSGREEMEKLVQAHPEFLLARFALDGWEAWDGLFLLPPWKPGIKSVHPAISAQLKAGYVIPTRDGLRPRATLFLRDAGGDFANSNVLQTVRIDITTMLSDTRPPLAIVYAKIWDNPKSPFQVEALGAPLYPRGNAQRCKYEYLCMQQDIDFAVIDNRDQILFNKRLPMPTRMKQVNAQLLKLLLGEAGREISDSELVSAVRAYQGRYSLDDVKY